MASAVIGRKISPGLFLPGLVKNIPSWMIVRHRSAPSHGYGSGIDYVQWGNMNGGGFHPHHHIRRAFRFRFDQPVACKFALRRMMAFVWI
jgi:hypothetical protein